MRQESPTDVAAIRAGAVAALQNAAHTDHTERFIVGALRKGRALMLALAASALAGCAPFWNSIVALDGAGAHDPSSVATIGIDARHPLILRGIDGRRVPGTCVQSALRSCTFLAAPGRHTLWASSVPAGIPLIVQSIRCYAIEVVLAPGSRYTLREDPGRDLAVALGPGSTEPLAIGRLVDKPLVIERNCRWR